jgi:hypothetical protein
MLQRAIVRTGEFGPSPRRGIQSPRCETPVHNCTITASAKTKPSTHAAARDRAHGRNWPSLRRGILSHRLETPVRNCTITASAKTKDPTHAAAIARLPNWAITASPSPEPRLETPVRNCTITASAKTKAPTHAAARDRVRPASAKTEGRSDARFVRRLRAGEPTPGSGPKP